MLSARQSLSSDFTTKVTHVSGTRRRQRTSWDVLHSSILKVGCFSLKVAGIRRIKDGAEKGKKELFLCLLLKKKRGNVTEGQLEILNLRERNFCMCTIDD